MNKREFAAAVRAWAYREPEKAEWGVMWEEYSRTAGDVGEIVARHLPRPSPPKREAVKDQRLIPDEYRATAVSLEELGAFARAVQEKLRKGGIDEPDTADPHIETGVRGDRSGVPGDPAGALWGGEQHEAHRGGAGAADRDPAQPGAQRGGDSGSAAVDCGAVEAGERGAG
jgi:hypothetical protein